MRTKEDAHDYRYFPEPDMMPMAPTEPWLADVKSRVIELPLARKQRLMQDYQIPAGDAEVFKANVPLAEYFENLARQTKNPKAVANWVINNLQAKLSEANVKAAADQAAMGIESSDVRVMTLADLKFKPEALLQLIGLVEAKTI